MERSCHSAIFYFDIFLFCTKHFLNFNKALSSTRQYDLETQHLFIAILPETLWLHIIPFLLSLQRRIQKHETSKMERFVKTANGFHRLEFAKNNMKQIKFIKWNKLIRLSSTTNIFMKLETARRGVGWGGGGNC